MQTMQQEEFALPMGSSFALSAQQLSEEQQQLLAKSLSAMLFARTGISHGTDPLLGNSCSSSPCMKPQEVSTTSGSMDTGCMQLPPPAVPMHHRPSALGAPQHHHLMAHHGGCHTSQSSHNSASNGMGDSMAAAAAAAPAHATPSSLFKACRLGDPCCYGSPATHSSEPAAAPAAQQQDECPAYTIEVPTCLGGADHAPAHCASQQHLEASPAADDAAACQDTDISMEAPTVIQQTQQQQQAQQPYRPRCVLNSPKAWLYELVTCPFLFKPCPKCSATNSGREVLITYFDTDNPTQGYCTYCPQRHMRPHLLQIRRSTYHEVVKAADVSRLTDVSGIQHYVINGAKVLFLRPRPQPRPPKGVVAPARCAVDGRQLMDAHSSYCSMRCKLEMEDVVFAANFPSSLDEQHLQGAAAGPDSSSPAGSYHKQGGHEGRRVVVPTHKRAGSAQGGSAQAALLQQSSGQHYDSCEDAGEGADGHCHGARHKRHRHMPSKFANTVVGGGGHQGAGSSRSNVPHLQRAHQISSSKARDDTASDQAAAGFQVTTSPGGTVGLAGLAGLHLLQDKGAVAGEAGSRRASPCGSDDSGRSTTCSQRAHKRKRAPPCRSALQ